MHYLSPVSSDAVLKQNIGFYGWSKVRGEIFFFEHPSAQAKQ
jgi:hypothetical protein